LAQIARASDAIAANVSRLVSAHAAGSLAQVRQVEEAISVNAFSALVDEQDVTDPSTGFCGDKEAINYRAGGAGLGAMCVYAHEPSHMLAAAVYCGIAALAITLIAIAVWLGRRHRSRARGVLLMKEAGHVAGGGKVGRAPFEKSGGFL
jgi:hypothetical protein